MPLPIEYDILVEANGQSTRIGWGDCPQWATRHRVELDAADYISLLPKDGADLPVVVLAKPEDAKWIVFSRVFGKIGAGVAQPQFRCYALGYQWNHDARPKAAKGDADAPGLDLSQRDGRGRGRTLAGPVSVEATLREFRAIPCA